MHYFAAIIFIVVATMCFVTSKSHLQNKNVQLPHIESISDASTINGDVISSNQNWQNIIVFFKSTEFTFTLTTVLFCLVSRYALSSFTNPFGVSKTCQITLSTVICSSFGNRPQLFDSLLIDLKKS